MVDPFTQVYDEIVGAFRGEARGRFQLVDWNSTRNPQHDLPQASDLPEVQIRPIGASVQLGGRSCATVVTRDHTVTLLTGDLVLGKILFPIEWLIVGILYRLQYKKLNALKFVEDVRVTNVTTGIVDPASTRSIHGWASAWNISVTMSFAEAQLGE